MYSELLARLEHSLRPHLVRHLPPRVATKLYSYGRRFFLKQYVGDISSEVYVPPKELERVCWGIRFRSPIFNAAGMFKNGEGYEVVSRQGAGAYLAGTTTALVPATNEGRVGNEKDGIYLPFAPYPSIGASSNWLGLPNDGDPIVAERLERQPRLYRCPIGTSVMGSPDLTGVQKLSKLVGGMCAYERAGVDFIEINESCPNTDHVSSRQELVERLQYVKTQFLDHRVTDAFRRVRPMPVIVKFSNDTHPRDIPFLLDTLFSLGYDGVNLGNTSTQYNHYGEDIHPREQGLYEYFTKTFGGGISGAPLREQSLALAATAVQYLRKSSPAHEFHVIRTGGIFDAEDIRSSEASGISLNQWFTGHWEAFARHGHRLYDDLYNTYVERLDRSAVKCLGYQLPENTIP